MRKIFYLILLFLVNLSIYSVGESIFDANGLGESKLQNNAFFNGIGGTGLAYSASNIYNVLNPASLAYLKTAYFSFNISNGIRNFSNQNYDYTNYTGEFPEFTIGLHIYKMFGIGFSYEMRNDFTYFSVIPTTEYSLHEKQIGGLNTYSIGFGYKYIDMALGLSLDIWKGEKKWSYNIDWNDSELDNTAYNVNTSYDGLSWKFAALFNSGKLDFALIYSPKFTLSSKIDLFNDYHTITKIDTSFTYPSILGIGIQYNLYKNFNLLVDFNRQNWGSLQHRWSANSLAYNEDVFSIGFIRVKPEKVYYKKYREKIEWGLGYYFKRWSYENCYQSVIYENAFSGRVTFPLAKDKLFLDLSVIAGMRGKIDSNGAAEKFLKFNITFRGIELWTIKKNVYEEE